ncbi:hypothetical protein Tco_1316615 [Tanacetum coccineum]
MNELNELHDQAYENSFIYKEKAKKIHDAKIKNRIFNVGPFTIAQVFPYGTIELSQIDGPNFKDCPDYEDSRARIRYIKKDKNKAKMDKSEHEIGRVRENKAEGVDILNGPTRNHLNGPGQPISL